MLIQNSKVYAARLVKKAYENWNDVRQVDAEASSSSMSEKISCSFPSEVLGDQQCLPPPRLAGHVVLKLPAITSASTVEGNGSTSAAGLPELSESPYSQNAMWNQTGDNLVQMEPSADTEVIRQLDGSL